MKDNFIQDWSTSAGCHEYCDTNRIIKTDFGMEQYLTSLSFFHRAALSRWRCRSNHLPIANSRFSLDDIRDEYHYFFMNTKNVEILKKMLTIYILLWNYLKIEIHGMYPSNWMIYMKRDNIFVCLYVYCFLITLYMQMAGCGTAVSQLFTHWSCCALELIHRHVHKQCF